VLRDFLRYAWERSPAENLTRFFFRLSPSARSAVLELPTVNDWWRLATKYPAFCQPTHTPIKDFGYLTVLDYLDEQHPKRVLEFGHGLWHSAADLLYARQDIEIWACDDFQSLFYYPTRAEEWHARYASFISQYPQARFVKCLLGDPGRTRTLLPENYFDLVFAVSVIEELEPEPLARVLSHAYDLMAPQGRLLCSFDVRVQDYQAITNLIRAVKSAGFEWRIESKFLPYANWDRALLESQISVMLYYQAWEGGARRYSGNWTTLIVDARKESRN
jgi:SAM-dependent methyltransferase